MSEQEKQAEEALKAAGEETPELSEAPESAEADLEADLAAAREEARRHYDQLLRMAAELENFKKRKEREQSLARKYAEEDLLKELLPTIDNLERALEQGREAGDVTQLLEGVELTLKGLLSALEKYGLLPIAGEGEPFDPNYHEAVAMEASEEAPANIVLKEFQKGYMYKDRLLRAAKVVVSKGPVK